MASQPRKRTRHSTSSSDSDSDTPQLELGNITADVSEDQLQSPLIPPNLLLNLGNTSSTPLEVGKLAAVAVEPVAAAVTSGLTGGLSTDSATPILLSAVPNIMSANVTGSNAPTQVSLQFSEPSPGVSTGAHSQSQTSLGLLVEPGNEPSLSSSNIPTNVTPSLQPEADLCGVLQHDVMQSLSALNAEFHKMSVELVTSDIHDREGSDYGGDDNRCFATTSPEISDSESDLDECADTPTDNSFEPGTLPAVTNKLYTGAPITILESFVSILSFAQSENLSGVGFVKLLKLIDLHCPKPNYCCRSYSELLRYFENVKTPLESHFYCNKCHRELTSLTDICQTCRDLKHSVDQVITLSIKDQLAQLYSRPGFLQDIEYRFNRKKINANNYEDLYDGLVYKKEANEGVLKDKQNVSIMWNGDGASPFGSSNLQIWPCFGVVNELPPNKRFKHENLLLFAIFIGQGKPTPNIFLKHVYPQVEVLKQGFHVMPAGYKESIIVKAVWLCGTCDSPAKALLFNQKYHNGFYACPKCLNKGEKSERTGNVFVHPYDAEDVLRTDMGYEEDAVLAAVTNAGRPKTSRIDSNGIKGTSFLHLMVSSMIESTSIDAMHCLYLGVTKQLLELWFSKKHRDEDFSLYNVQHVVNNRLLSINPPNFVKRMPRSLSELSKWKAYEFMLMLYYYLLPALSGIMGQIYFHNFKLFVSGVSLLDLDSISDQDVDNSKELLNQFVKDFQELYGMRNMSFNVHLVSHLWLVVKLLGPLWCTSCFRFEDFNGKLLCLIHGTRFVGSQIVSNLFSFLQLPQMVHCMETGEAKEFCIALLKKGKRVKIMECIKENYFTVGNYSKPTPVPEWMLNALQAFQFLSVFTFDRVKVNGMLITSENYRKSKTCSYYVRYTFQNEMLHGSVKTFVKLTMCQCEKACHCKGDFFAFVLQHNANDCFETANPPSSPKYVKKCVESQTLNIVPVSSIFNVCVYINMDNTMFLCDPLNFMEMYN